jgi:hypothetical protein
VALRLDRGALLARPPFLKELILVSPGLPFSKFGRFDTFAKGRSRHSDHAPITAVDGNCIDLTTELLDYSASFDARTGSAPGH